MDFHICAFQFPNRERELLKLALPWRENYIYIITSVHEWNVTKLKNLVSDPFLQLILAMSIPYKDIPDSICWGLSDNGNFSTKSATWLAHGLNLTNSPSWKFSWI